MAALAGAGVHEHGNTAERPGQAQRAAIGAALVVAAIYRDAWRNPVDPGEQAFGLARALFGQTTGRVTGADATSITLETA
jgi:hypothetical protein